MQQLEGGGQSSNGTGCSLGEEKTSLVSVQFLLILLICGVAEATYTTAWLNQTLT